MDYNLSYLRNRVLLDKLDDDSFEPEIVDRFLNDAQRAIFNSFSLPFMEKVFAGELTASSAIFTFPDDYKKVQSLVITSPEGLRRNLTDNYVGFRDFVTRFPSPTTNPVTAPNVWTLHGDKLYFSAPTDQNYTMTMYYVKRPAKMIEDDDTPEVPEDFEEILVLGAYYRILQRNEDFDLAAAVKSEYFDELDKLVPTYSPRQNGTPIVMGTPRNVRVR
jgi:hypothetical protein